MNTSLKKILIFTLNGKVVSASQEIKNYILDIPDNLLDFRKRSNYLEIFGEFYPPEKYDGCYILERPKDKKLLKELLFTSMFSPFLDRGHENMTIKEHTYNPQINAYYRRYEFKGIKFKNNIGTFSYWICDF